MSLIEKLPWYDDYNLVLEGRRIAEKSIEELENPEIQLQRIKKFYKNLGADYTKNNWLKQVEEDILNTNKDEGSRLNQLKQKVKFANILENAVQKQDNESVSALNSYKDDELYNLLVKKVLFYIGVSKVKKEQEFIKKAYDAINKTYSLEKASLFSTEGVYYYFYYFRCLRILIKQNKGKDSYDEICNQIRDRCYNARLMFDKYLTDMYLEKEIKLVIAEIAVTEAIMNEDENDL